MATRAMMEGTMTKALADHAFHVELDLDYEAALARTRDALKAEGFGVITEIDMRSTFQEKLGVEFRRYTILGACNPGFAIRALTADPEMGLLLPCNVIVYETADEGGSMVSLVDPLAMLGDVSDAALHEVAGEVHGRLSLVAEALRA
jgi:uncharacterized protein (DUF302 family)